MAIIITAPMECDINVKDRKVSCFLAGGINKCSEWQREVIRILDAKDTSSLVLYNPRRDNFDINNPDATVEQICWEFNKLNEMDIFSMYFDNSESVQPICFYELGRHLERMKNRFPHDWRDRIIVSVKRDFSRVNDVVIQTHLALGEDVVKIVDDVNEHAEDIYECYCRVIKKKEKVLAYFREISELNGLTGEEFDKKLDDINQRYADLPGKWKFSDEEIKKIFRNKIKDEG